MLRFIIVIIYVVFFCIIGLPVLLVEMIVGKFDKKMQDRIVFAFVKWGLGCVVSLSGSTVDFIGEENVPKDKPVLYILNHRSFFDTIITYQRVPRPTGYMGKIQMKKLPIISSWMKAAHCVFIDRNDIKQGLRCILECIDDIKHGISIAIFPEGTRSKVEGEFLPFHEGSFKVATKTGCPIIPVTINNSAAVWEDQMPRVKRAHVIVEYGKPIYPDSLTPEEKKHVGSYVRDIMIDTWEKNSHLV